LDFASYCAVVLTVVVLDVSCSPSKATISARVSIVPAPPPLLLLVEPPLAVDARIDDNAVVAGNTAVPCRCGERATLFGECPRRPRRATPCRF